MTDEIRACDICSEEFSTSYARATHILTAHPNGASIAEMQPDNADEQAASGSTPSPDSDDDTLANAQSMGLQLGEDEEHPQELNIARDIDSAEEYLRTH